MQIPESLGFPLYNMQHLSNFGSNYSHAKLVIERQPKKRGYRFRYASEGKTHGMLPGEVDSSKKEQEKKVFPTIKLENHRGPAKVVMTLVSDKEPNQMHPHTLLVDKHRVPGCHLFDISAGEYKLELKSVAIQHVIKEKMIDTMKDRILQTKYANNFRGNSYMQPYGQDRGQIDAVTYLDCLKDRELNQGFFDRKTKIDLEAAELEKLNKEAKNLAKSMSMSSCKLCFVTFLQDQNGKFTQVLDPVYSDVIIDGKKKEGAPLKIIRTSHVACSVEGGKEIWLLSDKVDADDTEIYFYEKRENKDGIYWEGYGEFNKTDVYKQSLIVFKTPPYVDKAIDQPRTVSMQLRRKRDRECVSDIHQFMYKPKHYDRYGLREKRRKQLPEGVYYPPPAKRAATDRAVERQYNGGDRQSPVHHRHSPANPTDDTENPSLSDFVFPDLKGIVNGNSAVGTVIEGQSSSSTGAFNFSPHLLWSNNDHQQLKHQQLMMTNYSSPGESGEESRGS